jgi:hypothetical protein
MGSLVECRCGHDVENHGAKGCPGSARESCSCPLTAAAALDAAVSAVRSTFRDDAEARRRLLQP